MKIGLESNIIRYCLRDVYFITGTAYAGKSTMVKMLADKYGMVFCGENYHDGLGDKVKEADRQPNLCYFQTMKDWQEFVNRSPEEYDRWIRGCSSEAAEVEIAELLRLSGRGGKIIVDTNIPLDILREIADYHHVAVMLSPQRMSVEEFFNREDEEKQFILQRIYESPDPEKTLANYRACIAQVNSEEHYREYAESGFYVWERKDCSRDTRQEVLKELENHFRLNEEEGSR